MGARGSSAALRSPGLSSQMGGGAGPTPSRSPPADSQKRSRLPRSDTCRGDARRPPSPPPSSARSLRCIGAPRSARSLRRMRCRFEELHKVPQASIGCPPAAPARNIPRRSSARRRKSQMRGGARPAPSRPPSRRVKLAPLPKARGRRAGLQRRLGPLGGAGAARSFCDWKKSKARFFY